MKRFYWVVISLLFFSCENEIGRVDLLKNNAEEVQFELQEGDVISLYTEIDIEYIKKPLFVYQFEFFKDGYPLYRDRDHLSKFGARYLEPLFLPVFDTITSKNK